MNGILDPQEISNHWSYAVVIFREDCLEHRKVVLGHFVCNLVYNINELSVDWVFAHIKNGWLKTLCNHVISV